MTTETPADAETLADASPSGLVLLKRRAEAVRSRQDRPSPTLDELIGDIEASEAEYESAQARADARTTIGTIARSRPGLAYVRLIQLCGDWEVVAFDAGIHSLSASLARDAFHRRVRARAIYESHKQERP